MAGDGGRVKHQTKPTSGPCLCAALVAGCLMFPSPGLAEQDRSVVWVLNNLERIGGQAVSVAGSPTVVQTPIGAAVEFNGATDGLFLERIRSRA